LVRTEHPERAHVARRLREDDVARVDEELRDEVEGLLRPGGRHDVVDRAADPFDCHDLEDLLAKLGNSLTRAVLQGNSALLSHHSLHCRGDQVVRQRRHERHSTGERDDLGAGGDGEEGSYF
jgi:hypothetical protein